MDCFNLFSTLYWQTFEKGLEQISGELAEPTQAIKGHKGTPDICHFLYATILFRTAKSTPKKVRKFETKKIHDKIA